MSIEIACPGCQRTLRVPDSAAGKKARCPQCQQVVDIPQASPAADLFSESAPEPTPSHREAAPASPLGDLFSEPLPAKPATASPDSSNPYAASGFHELAKPTPGTHVAALNPTRISFDEVFNLTWRIFQLHIGPLALVGLIAFAIQAVMQVLGFGVNLLGELANEPAISIATGFGVNVLQFLVTPIVTLGYSVPCLLLLRQGQTSPGDFMKFVPFYGRCLLKDFLFTLMLMAILAFAAVPVGILAAAKQPEAAVVVGVLLGIAAITAFIWVTISFYLANFFIIDRQAGAIESLQLSWRFMAGNRLTVFGLTFVFGLVGGLLACCTLGLGSIVVTPFFFLMSAVSYMLATGQRGAIAPSLVTA